MRIAAVTNAYNEAFNLPIWLRHYGRELGPENCVVIDHGSEALPDLGGASLIQTPRSPFDDGARARTVSGVLEALLEHYDLVLYADADEILLPDPAEYAGLREFFERTDARAYTAVGLDLFHNLLTEEALDPGRLVLDQRRFVTFNSWLCKTLATREPIRWGGGFHTASAPPRFGGLYLFHIRWVDLGETLKRAALTRRVEVRNAGSCHQESDAYFVRVTLGASNWPSRDDFDTVVPELTREVEASVRLAPGGLHHIGAEVRPNFNIQLPERFRGRF